MAGIGFELKKLFQGKGYIENIKAYFISSLVTIGPMILCISLVTVLQFLLLKKGVSFSQRELFQSATVYAFIFSLIVASTMIMLGSRYIADNAFQKNYDRLLSSLYGILVFCIVIGGMAGIIFYYFSKLDFYFRLAAYTLYMELIIIWIQAIYISLFKDYFKILRGFLYGVSIAIILSYVLLFHTSFEPVLGLMISVDSGFFIIVISYMHYFIKNLPSTDTNIFSFISYFDKFPSLFFISFFYNFGMYSHDFVFWFSQYGFKVGDTYWFSPVYDVPMFYAYFTITPTLVLFVVSVETSFYNKYKNYYQNVLKDGNFQEISSARKEMSSVLVQEISYIMEVQLIFSVISIILGRRFLPMAGLTGLSIDIFSILVLGCYVFVMMFIIVLILLYFDDRKGALATIAFFLPSNIILSKITLDMGESFFGVGFFVASLISLIIGMGRLVYYIININYYTFCSQPILYKEKKGFFTRLSLKLGKKKTET